jgi:hypothetical protein
MKKLYIAQSLIFIALAGISCIAGYFIMQYGLHAILSGIATLIIFALLNFLFKTITVEEILGYLRK